jgi:hypothetical protein
MSTTDPAVQAESARRIAYAGRRTQLLEDAEIVTRQLRHHGEIITPAGRDAATRLHAFLGEQLAPDAPRPEGMVADGLGGWIPGDHGPAAPLPAPVAPIRRPATATAYMLPTGTRMNPHRPESAEFYNVRQTGYVVRKLGTTRDSLRVLTSYGEADPAWAVGTRHQVYHDQTNRDLGVFEVIGAHVFKSGVTAGQVPDRTISHWVFK